MVQTLNKVAAGEERASLLAKSMRGMMVENMEKDGASEDQIA